MPTIEEKIALAREARDAAQVEFVKALRAGRKKGMSWSRLATVAGMSIYNTRYHTLNLNKQRRQARREAAKDAG